MFCEIWAALVAKPTRKSGRMPDLAAFLFSTTFRHSLKLKRVLTN
jgi:hypothetical protein